MKITNFFVSSNKNNYIQLSIINSIILSVELHIIYNFKFTINYREPTVKQFLLFLKYESIH